MSAELLDVLLVVMTWTGLLIQVVFWHSVHWMLRNRRYGVRSSDRLRMAMRYTRRMLWPAYAMWAVSGLAMYDSTLSRSMHIFWIVVYAWINWMDWKRSKDLDDDDWMKKLVEKGLGVVERVGNKLAVVVPAPAGA